MSKLFLAICSSVIREITAAQNSIYKMRPPLNQKQKSKIPVNGEKVQESGFLFLYSLINAVVCCIYQKSTGLNCECLPMHLCPLVPVRLQLHVIFSTSPHHS